MGFDLEIALKWAQIVAYVTVPIIVGVLGHLVTRSIATQNLARDYVGLGLGILREPRSADNANLHDWAVLNLQTYSPIPFSLAARKELSENRLAKPLGRLGQAGDRGGSIVVTPDGTKVVARDDDGSIRVWDLATGKEVARLQG
jgi:WD40 repeat protein